MEHILISSSARRTEACAALDNEPLFSGPRVLLFPPRSRKKGAARAKYIWEAITASDLMCKMCSINHVVRVIDKRRRHAAAAGARPLFCYI